MYSSSEESDSDSGANFKRGKRKPKEESPLKPVKRSFDDSTHSRRDGHRDKKETSERRPEAHRRDDSRLHKAEDNRSQRSQEVRNKPQHSNDSKHARDLRSRSRERHEARKPNLSSDDRRKRNEVNNKRSRSNENSRNRRDMSPVSRKVVREKSPLGKISREKSPAARSGDKSSSRRDNHKEGHRADISRLAEVSRNPKFEKNFKESQHRSKSPQSYRHRSKSLRKSESKTQRSNHNSKDSREHPKPTEEKNRVPVKSSLDSKKKSRSSSQDYAAYGPALPPPRKIEPDDRSEKRRSDSPHERRHRNIGPSLPKNFRLPEMKEYQHSEILSSDDDSMTIGPLPSSLELSERDLELEKRKIEIKLQQLDRRMEAMNSTDTKHREEWMLELPEIKKVPDMGLTARQFRKNARPDFSDRSSWTKTPNDQHKKPSHQESAKNDDDKKRALEMRRRDEEQERVAKEHKKSHKRDKTLLEIHEKKLRKERKKQKDEKKERVPFNRDNDLSANKFDEARKKSALKKAQLLDTRFSSGDRKYL